MSNLMTMSSNTAILILIDKTYVYILKGALSWEGPLAERGP